MLDMFDQPEVSFEQYSEAGNPRDDALHQAIERGDVILVRSESYYYKHPDEKRLFIRLNPAERKLSEWEEGLVATGPAYLKNILKLSERKRREFEIWQKIKMEDTYRQRQQVAMYAFDVFLSYSDRDHAVADTTHERLGAVGAKVFMAPKSLTPGDDFAEEIRQALTGSSELWVIVSPNSLTSEWVTTEWGAAWVLGKRIVPILHRCDVSQLPARLRNIHCIDAASIGAFIDAQFPSPEGGSAR